MIHLFQEQGSNGTIKLLLQETSFDKNFYANTSDSYLFTIAFNLNEEQTVTIDNVSYSFPQNTILPLMVNQSFYFQYPEKLIILQFNREFYCIVNHDAEVGCVGFLFYGLNSVMFINFLEEMTDFNTMITQFLEEFANDEEIKATMLRMLLVRFIIKTTRIAKKQFLGITTTDEKFNLLRSYNLLVEIHFRKEKTVKFYADQLNKSPKTIANIFSLYSKKTPLQIIHERIITEARRLFYYTDKSIKEIAGEVGFDDASQFSKFFKNFTNISPSSIRRNSEK